MPFGFVVDDDGADKRASGGAAAFAGALGDGAPDPTHRERCPSCQAAGEAYACVGLVPTPISPAAERWLVERLPEDIESLPGFLLRKAIAEYGYDGAEGERLRSAGLLAGPGAFTRHFGPFFRRFTVSSEQLLEEMLCAGNVSPSHALAILVQLGALSLDGQPALALDQGPALGDLMKDPAARRARTRFALPAPGGDGAAADPSLEGLWRYLRALHAGFVVDATVQVYAPPEAAGEAGGATSG
jgi:hypothetical protein